MCIAENKGKTEGLYLSITDGNCLNVGEKKRGKLTPGKTHNDHMSVTRGKRSWKLKVLRKR